MARSKEITVYWHGVHFKERFDDNRYDLWCNECFLSVRGLETIKSVKKFIKDHKHSNCTSEVKIAHYNNHCPDNWHVIALNIRSHGRKRRALKKKQMLLEN